VPFGRIVQGMHVVDAVYSGYRDRPQADTIRKQGDAYLQREFPRLSHIVYAQQVAFVEEPLMISKNVMGAFITVGMAVVAALGCFVFRLLQRRTKGYARPEGLGSPRSGTFDDPEDDDADEDDDAVECVATRLTQRS